MTLRNNWLRNNYNTHIAYISRSKDSQTIKFGQLIEYKREILCFEKYIENEAWRLVSDLFLFF